MTVGLNTSESVCNNMPTPQYHDESWLRQKYHGENLTSTEIAEIVDVAPSTIAKWMKRLSIKKRRDIPDKYQQESWLTEKYHDEQMTIYEMADEVNISAQTILRYMDKFGIDRRADYQVTGEAHPNFAHGQSQEIYHLLLEAYDDTCWQTIRSRHRERNDECEMCSTSDSLSVHHIVPIMAGGTNGAYNLMTLCRSCHRGVEHKTRELVDPVIGELDG